MQKKFLFEKVSLCHIAKQIKVVNFKKSSTITDIPLEVLKRNLETTVNVLQNFLNGSFETDTFLDNMKFTNITPVFKKKDPLGSTNYHQVSLLLILSKLFAKMNELNGLTSNCLLIGNFR